MTIWEFDDYRSYLVHKLGGDGQRTGERKRLAEALSVHTTFVSQVLKERAEFSLEQAEGINTFFSHTEDEGDYFILLVMHHRAGTKKLQQRFQQKIAKMREDRNNIRKRLEMEETISVKDREKFYSSFVYGAVHVLTAIPEYKSADALAAVLRLPLARVKETVEFMLRIGVLQEKNGELSPGSQFVHIGTDTELILKHHANWRLHTLSNLQFLDKDDLHYSGCMSLSAADAARVKESILQNLKTNMKTIGSSPEEVAFVMNLDFYKLI